MKKRVVLTAVMLAALLSAAAAAAVVGADFRQYDSDKYLKCADIFRYVSADYEESGNALNNNVNIIKGSSSRQVNDEINRARHFENELSLDLDSIGGEGFYEEFLISGMDSFDDFMMYKKLSFVSRAERKFDDVSVRLCTSDERLSALCVKYSACDTVQNGRSVKTEVSFKATQKTQETQTDELIVYSTQSSQKAVIGGEKIKLSTTDRNCIPDSVSRYTADISAVRSGEYEAAVGDDKITLNISDKTSPEVSIATVVTESAEPIALTSDGGKYRPDLNPLPQGTVDECTVSGDVCTLKSGGSFYLSNDSKGEIISVEKGVLPSFSVAAVLRTEQTDRGDTRLLIGRECKAPFKVELLGQEYKDLSQTDPRPNGEVSACTISQVRIVFCSSTAPLGTADVSKSTVFESARWEKTSGGYALRLTLNETGAFYGYSAEYENDNLVFTFNEPPKLESADNDYGVSLKNAVIVLDAGHGGSDPGALDGKEEIKESVLNLSLAKKIRQKLEAVGARVVMTRTDESDLTLEKRTSIARAAKADIFVSVHRNSSENTAAAGYSDYYYNAYSMPLAKTIFDYSSRQFKPLKTEYYPFYVTRITDCPAVLTENGFLSNADEAARISDGDFDEKLAENTAVGIIEYLKSISK